MCIYQRIIINLLIMEIQALLTSYIIPNEIVSNEIYKHLWRIMNLLNEEQTEALQYKKKKKKKIIRTYFNSEEFFTSCGEKCEEIDLLSSSFVKENVSGDPLTEENVEILRSFYRLSRPMTRSMKIQLNQHAI